MLHVHRFRDRIKTMQRDSLVCLTTCIVCIMASTLFALSGLIIIIVVYPLKAQSVRETTLVPDTVSGYGYVNGNDTMMIETPVLENGGGCTVVEPRVNCTVRPVWIYGEVYEKRRFCFAIVSYNVSSSLLSSLHFMSQNHVYRNDEFYQTGREEEHLLEDVNENDQNYNFGRMSHGDDDEQRQYRLYGEQEHQVRIVRTETDFDELTPYYEYEQNQTVPCYTDEHRPDLISYFKHRYPKPNTYEELVVTGFTVLGTGLACLIFLSTVLTIVLTSHYYHQHAERQALE